MLAKLMGRQLLSPFSAEISTTIRVTKMLFCAGLVLYCGFSHRFRQEFQALMRFYRKYGIQYAMIGHARAHIIPKLTWLIFI